MASLGTRLAALVTYKNLGHHESTSTINTEAGKPKETTVGIAGYEVGGMGGSGEGDVHFGFFKNLIVFICLLFVLIHKREHT